MSVTTPQDIRRRLRDGKEIALFDLREEAPFAAGHPLFAVNLPLGRIEERLGALAPRHDVPIVVYDDGEGRVARALPLIERLGYTDVTALEGGLAGWRRSGGEIFIDVNVPSKSFGELVEHQRHTPSIPARTLHERVARGDDLVILDARRFSEYNTMSIPGGRSTPGAELALRARDLAPSPETTIVVNCAGRTRSIIGAQSLINAGIENPVFALRNGTIGWTLEGLDLAKGATAKAGAPSPANAARARAAAGRLAERTGVRVIGPDGLARLQADPDRTLYRLDARDPEEYSRTHLAGFRSAPGGQLIQATDEWIGVRHGTIVLTDDDGVRAPMTAHWLRQLGWREVYVLDDWGNLPRATGAEVVPLAAPAPDVPQIAPEALADLPPGSTLLVDLAESPTFRRGHVPGARFALRSDLEDHPALAEAGRVIVTSPDGIAARFAVAALRAAGHDAVILAGGTQGWAASGRALEAGLDADAALSVPDDVYKRPYEGTDNARAAMQAYLDWEFGLVAQLERDGTHGFTVLEAAPEPVPA